MKTLNNIQVMRDGKPVTDADSNQPLTLLSVLKTVLDNVQYENRAQLRAADKVYAKLEALDGSAQLTLEDADYELLLRHASSYQPILQGRVFVQVFEELEAAE